MTAVVTAGAGFLLAVVWFDLMHDVQVRGHRGASLPDPVLASIAGYYRRVTTGARPMNRLVAAFMLVTIAGVAGQLAGGHEPLAAVVASAALVAGAVGLAGARTVRNAVRLGARRDPPEVQSALARRIYGDHVACAIAMAAVLVLQLAVVR